MKTQRFRSLAILAIAAAALAACAYTPTASREMDSAMKQFPVYSDAATIYVYRSYLNRADEWSTLYMDGHLVGTTRPGTYFRIDTVPARHVFHGTGVDPGSIAVKMQAGQIYFLRLDVIARESNFRLEPAAVGRKQLLDCCDMIEVWPGGIWSAQR